MPIYEYQCDTCGITFDRVFKVSSRPTELICYDCGGRARQVILTPPATHGEEASWVTEAALAARKEQRFPHKGNKPIETRSEWKKWVKENPHVRETDGHNLSEV
jgi:putative FmdB family regulatory protein